MPVTPPSPPYSTPTTYSSADLSRHIWKGINYLEIKPLARIIVPPSGLDIKNHKIYMWALLYISFRNSVQKIKLKKKQTPCPNSACSSHLGLFPKSTFSYACSESFFLCPPCYAKASHWVTVLAAQKVNKCTPVGRAFLPNKSKHAARWGGRACEVSRPLDKQVMKNLPKTWKSSHSHT